MVSLSSQFFSKALPRWYEKGIEHRAHHMCSDLFVGDLDHRNSYSRC